MGFRYQSGEEIRKGDRILFHDESGEVEFITTTLGDNPELDYYIQEFGGGIGLISVSFGRVFISDTQDTEDLTFVCRG